MSETGARRNPSGWVTLPYEFVANPETDQVVALGSPPPDHDVSEDSPLYHNCDRMGCGSVGAHVVDRFQLPIGTMRRLLGPTPGEPDEQG